MPAVIQGAIDASLLATGGIIKSDPIKPIVANTFEALEDAYNFIVNSLNGGWNTTNVTSRKMNVFLGRMERVHGRTMKKIKEIFLFVFICIVPVTILITFTFNNMNMFQNTSIDKTFTGIVDNYSLQNNSEVLEITLVDSSQHIYQLINKQDLNTSFAELLDFGDTISGTCTNAMNKKAIITEIFTPVGSYTQSSLMPFINDYQKWVRIRGLINLFVVFIGWLSYLGMFKYMK